MSSSTGVSRIAAEQATPVRAAIVLVLLALVLGGTLTTLPGVPAHATGSVDGGTNVLAAGSLVVSASADGARPAALSGQTLRGSVYVYAQPPRDATTAWFYLDDPHMLQRPVSMVSAPPFSLQGAKSGLHNPWDTTTIGDGPHTLSVLYHYAGGRAVVEHAEFAVRNSSTAPAAAAAGLTFSEGELAVWRQRAVSGPYRTTGDVSANSPGDWTRIQNNAAAFMSNPASNRWNGPSGTGCVEAGAENPPSSGMDRLRDAAFVSLVTGNETMKQAVRHELVAQARMAGVNFADTSRWCTGRVHDLDPSFGIAFWMTRLLLAYDYVGEDTFTAQENQDVRSWFWHGARWLQLDVDRKLDDNFVNRAAGDYRLSSMRASNPGWGKVGFLGSQQTGSIARYYNNRRATAMFFVALVGVQQDDATFTASSKRFVKEWLRFSVYPDGWTGEFERWRSDLPDLGWAYSTYNVALAAMTADLFARQGDTELYTFTTSDGVHGTQGGTKGLRTVMRDHARYIDGTTVRYGTGQTPNATTSYRIDGVNGTWRSVHDVAATTIGNLYYKDDYLKNVYLRTAPGTTAYPASAASQGPFNAWQGVWGIYPGVLFMYGQMEATSPY